MRFDSSGLSSRTLIRSSSLLLFSIGVVFTQVHYGQAHSLTRNVTNQEGANNAASQENKTPQHDPEHQRKTIKRLRAELAALRQKVAELEHSCQSIALRDQLIKEEQLAQSLQSELVTVGEKEAALQARMDQVNEQLRSENIDQLQVMGSVHPEQVRESARRQLSNEKQRIQTQLDLLQHSKMRIQSALSTADLVIQRLHGQLQGAVHP